MEFDSVQIGTPDLEAASRAYALLLGVPAHAFRFQLRFGAVELQRGDSGVRSIRFRGGPEDKQPRSAESFHGLRVYVDAAPPAVAADIGADAVDVIDHVVINTPNLDRAIALWRDELGLRLALDREFPNRGLRMAFFRSAGITLEFVSPLPRPDDASGPDGFYGMAYRVGNLAACRARLLHAGLDVSEVRPGQKRGSIVASVRSGTAGVPTLLIEDPSRT